MPTLALDKADRELMIQIIGNMSEMDIITGITPEFRPAVRNLRDRISAAIDAGDFNVIYVGQEPLSL